MSDIDIDRFVPAPDPELICPICHSVLHSPYETPCQHVFCKVCIYTWMKQGPGATMQGGNKCPSCRDFFLQGELRAALPILNNLLNNLKVKCINQECQAVLAKEYLKEHEKKCEYAEVECSNNGCIIRLIRRDAEKHKLSCKLRIVHCTKECQLPMPHLRLRGHSCTHELKQELKGQYLEAAVLREIIYAHDSTRVVSRDSLRNNFSRAAADCSFNRARFMSNHRDETGTTLRLSEIEILRQLSNGQDPPPVAETASDVTVGGNTPTYANEANSSVSSNEQYIPSSPEYSDVDAYIIYTSDDSAVNSPHSYINEPPQSPQYQPSGNNAHEYGEYQNYEDDNNNDYTESYASRSASSDDNEVDEYYEADAISEEIYENDTDDSDHNGSGSGGNQTGNGTEEGGGGSDDSDNGHQDDDHGANQSDDADISESGSGSASDHEEGWQRTDEDLYNNYTWNCTSESEEDAEHEQESIVLLSSGDDLTRLDGSRSNADPSLSYVFPINNNKIKPQSSSFSMRRENNYSVQSDSSDGSESDADHESENAATPDSGSVTDVFPLANQQPVGSDSEGEAISSPNDSYKVDRHKAQARPGSFPSDATAQSSGEEDKQIDALRDTSVDNNLGVEQSHAAVDVVEEGNVSQVLKDLSCSIYRQAQRIIDSSDDELSADEELQRRQSIEKSDIASVRTGKFAEQSQLVKIENPSRVTQDYISEGSFQPDYTSQDSEGSQGKIESNPTNGMSIKDDSDNTVKLAVDVSVPQTWRPNEHDRLESSDSETEVAVISKMAPRDIPCGGRRGRLGKRRRKLNHMDSACVTEAPKKMKPVKSSASLAERASVMKRKLAECLKECVDLRKKRKKVTDCV